MVYQPTGKFPLPKFDPIAYFNPKKQIDRLFLDKVLKYINKFLYYTCSNKKISTCIEPKFVKLRQNIIKFKITTEKLLFQKEPELTNNLTVATSLFSEISTFFESQNQSVEIIPDLNLDLVRNQIELINYYLEKIPGQIRNIQTQILPDIITDIKKTDYFTIYIAWAISKPETFGNFYQVAVNSLCKRYPIPRSFKVDISAIDQICYGFKRVRSQTLKINSNNSLPPGFISDQYETKFLGLHILTFAFIMDSLYASGDLQIYLESGKIPENKERAYRIATLPD